MKILLVDNQTKHIEDWKRLASENNLTMKIVTYSELEPNDAALFDLTILSGGTGLAVPKSRELLAREIELIKTTTRPLLGVCLGFELIADTFGASLLYRQERVTGIVDIAVIKPDPVFGSLSNFKAQEAHKYYIETLPENFEVLARSEFGIEVFKHRTQRMYGFQFHPEVILSENDGTQIFLNFIESLRP